MNIPFFDYKYSYLKNKKNLNKIFENVCSKGAFIMQEDLKKFENNICKYTGSKYAIGVGNATDGLYMSLKCAGMRNGDEAIISSHTMIATASAIHFAGGVPVPVDFGNDLLINYDSIEKFITKKTKFLIPTQLNGRTCDMERIKKICLKYNLILLEDAAQALGSKFKNKFAGTFGLASSISFYPAKILGCFGDGGIILTNSENFYKKLMSFRDHGRDFKTGKINSWGVNSRLDNIQAAILNFFLKSHNKAILKRRIIAKIYHERLGGLERIILPPKPDKGNHFDIFQNFEIQADKRDNLKLYLSKKNIGTLVQWSGYSINKLRILKKKNRINLESDKKFAKLIMTPMNISLDKNQVNKICDEILNFYKKN
jgi:dTDP-4-amino-4,6-dideoxygalactose transaminase